MDLADQILVELDLVEFGQILAGVDSPKFERISIGDDVTKFGSGPDQSNFSQGWLH